MECPRCGGSLTEFALAGSTATVCESCEYVGVPADHRPDPSAERESWEEALERFHGGEDDDDGETDEVDEDSDVDADADDGPDGDDADENEATDGDDDSGETEDS